MSIELFPVYHVVPCSQNFYDTIKPGDEVRIEGKLCEVVERFPKLYTHPGMCGVEVRHFRLI